MADSQHPCHALTAWSTHQCVAGLLGWELGDFCFFFCEYCLLYVYSGMGHEQNIVLDLCTGFPTACLEGSPHQARHALSVWQDRGSLVACALGFSLLLRICR